jgi:Nitrile hydratase beta subunit
MIERSYHDMGGLPAGKVEPGGIDATHDYAEWERRVDAMSVLLQGIKPGTKRLITVDERRRAIEMLPPKAYDAMTYYERWVVALAETLIQRGILTTEEMARKLVEVEKRDSR